MIINPWVPHETEVVYITKQENITEIFVKHSTYWAWEQWRKIWFLYLEMCTSYHQMRPQKSYENWWFKRIPKDAWMHRLYALEVDELSMTWHKLLCGHVMHTLGYLGLKFWRWAVTIVSSNQCIEYGLGGHVPTHMVWIPIGLFQGQLKGTPCSQGMTRMPRNTTMRPTCFFWNGGHPSLCIKKMHTWDLHADTYNPTCMIRGSWLERMDTSTNLGLQKIYPRPFQGNPSS
jgi:hypothetical protein